MKAQAREDRKGGRERGMKGATTYRQLDLIGKVQGQILIHDPIGRGKERQDVRNEMPLIVRELLPVRLVVGQVQLLRRPEGGLGLLVHVPDLLGGEGGREGRESEWVEV